VTADDQAPGRFGAYVASAWWTAVGACVSIGIVGLLTIGVYFLAGAVVLALVGLRVSSVRRGSVPMVIAGLAAAPLLLAWLNRQGPGTVCHSDGSVTACSERWSPWPFAMVALVLVVAGAVLARRRRSSVNYADMRAAAPE
jgi:hypothetical protein